MEKKTGIALIGYGGMGSWHVRTIRKIPELECKGIHDIDPVRVALAKEREIPVYASMEDLLADEDVSIVTVALPNQLHKDVCIRAMEAGKNVVCEKPVALNHTELQEMIAAAKANNVLFTVHQNRRWDEDWRTIRYIYDQGTLGKVFRIESRVHGSRGIPGDWRNRPECGGGMVLDWGVHLLDQILQMCTMEVESIYSTLSFVTNEACDDGFTTTIQFAGGLTAIIEVGTSNFINLPRWYMLGENGSAIIEDWKLNGKIVMVSDWEKRDAVPVVTAAGLTKTMAPRTEETIREYPLPKQNADILEFYRNVIAASQGKEEQLIRHDELLRVMLMMEAIFESAQNNTVITDFEQRCKEVIG